MSKSTFVAKSGSAYPTVCEIHREYFATYAALDPEAAEAMELLKAEVSFNRVAALYPSDLGQLTHRFAALVHDEAAVAPFVKEMEDRGLGLIHQYASSLLMNEFFLMPDRLDFSSPRLKALSYASYPKHDYLALMGVSPLEKALAILADGLWLGSNWHRLVQHEDPMVGRQLLSVLRSHRSALQTLDSEMLAAVS